MNSRSIALRSFIAFLLMTEGQPLWAAWDRVYETKTAVHYIDPETVQKNGHLRRVSTLQDLRQQGDRGELSMRALMEYDCDQKRVRVISATAHRGQMATREIVSRVSSPAQWISIAPESAFNTTLRFVCTQ